MDIKPFLFFILLLVILSGCSSSMYDSESYGTYPIPGDALFYELKTSADSLYFASREWDVFSNSATVITFGITNVDNVSKELRVEIYELVGDSYVLLSPSQNEKSFLWVNGTQLYLAGEGKPFDMIYTAPRSMGDEYIYNIVLKDDATNEILDEQKITIT
jgi:hypothetical protein